jgi:hypothetical protein
MNVSADLVASTSGRPAMASADTRPITLALHPQRDALANEVHARPTMPLEAWFETGSHGKPGWRCRDR